MMEESARGEIELYKWIAKHAEKEDAILRAELKDGCAAEKTKITEQALRKARNRLARDIAKSQDLDGVCPQYLMLIDNDFQPLTRFFSPGAPSSSAPSFAAATP